MPTIPLDQKFHTVAASVDTVNRGSAQANSDREVYTMQDIVSDIGSDFIGGSGSAATIPLFTDSTTIGDSIIGQVAGLIVVNGVLSTTTYRVGALNAAPATATSAGVLGEIRYTADFIYVCIAANVWVRSPLTTF
jgi:hypothetical protein